MSEEVKDGGAAFRWYASRDAENYTIGPFETREEVIEEATNSDLGYDYEAKEDPKLNFHIMEATKADFHLADQFDVSDWFEHLENGPIYDLGDPDGDGILSVITKDAGDDLEARVRQTIRQWQTDHKISFDVWSFSSTRGGEWITVPLRAEAADAILSALSSDQGEG